MGNKRERKGKHLFFHGACLLTIFLLISGCGTTSSSQKKSQINTHLEQAEKLISEGDYAGAVTEYEAVAGLSPGQSPGDSALYRMGLAWAHPDNPDRNYGKALECFKRTVSEVPGSALIQEASTWISAINELLWLNSKIKDLEGTIDVLKNELDALKEADKKVEEKNRELEETVKTLKKQLSALKETGLAMEEKNKDLEEIVKALENQLNALKEIDLGIDEKKR